MRKMTCGVYLSTETVACSQILEYHHEAKHS